MRFQHVRWDKNLQFTLAYSYNEDVITMGVSKCSHKDTFKKSEGRKLAQERATSNPIILKINKFVGIKGTIEQFIWDMTLHSVELMTNRKFNYLNLVEKVKNDEKLRERKLVEKAVDGN